MAKTISELNSKIVIRILKVLYVLTYFVSILFLALIAYFEGAEYGDNLTSLKIILEGLLFIVIIFEVIIRIYYYIALGELFPKGTEWKWCIVMVNKIKKGYVFIKEYDKKRKKYFIYGLIIIALAFDASYYYFRYIPNQIIKNYSTKLLNDYNSQEPKSAKEFLDFMDEQSNYRVKHNIPSRYGYDTALVIYKDFISKYPDEKKTMVSLIKNNTTEKTKDIVDECQKLLPELKERLLAEHKKQYLVNHLYSDISDIQIFYSPTLNHCIYSLEEQFFIYKEGGVTEGTNLYAKIYDNETDKELFSTIIGTQTGEDFIGYRKYRSELERYTGQNHFE